MTNLSLLWRHGVGCAAVFVKPCALSVPINLLKFGTNFTGRVRASVERVARLEARPNPVSALPDCFSRRLGKAFPSSSLNRSAGLSAASAKPRVDADRPSLVVTRFRLISSSLTRVDGSRRVAGYVLCRCPRHAVRGFARPRFVPGRPRLNVDRHDCTRLCLLGEGGG